MFQVSNRLPNDVPSVDYVKVGIWAVMMGLALASWIGGLSVLWMLSR